MDARKSEASLALRFSERSEICEVKALTAPYEDQDADCSSVSVMEEILKDSDGAGFLSFASLTNLSVLLHTCSDLKEKIAWISFSGGSFRGGDVTVSAERNVFLDPEAAYSVLHSDVKLYLVPLETDSLIPPHLYERYDLCFSSSSDRRVFRNLLACLLPLYPEAFEARRVYADAELHGRFSRGALVKDVRNLWKKEGNVNVLEGIHIDVLEEVLEKTTGNGREAKR